MLSRQAGGETSLCIFTEYALNNARVRYRTPGGWQLNLTNLITHIESCFKFSPLDLDLEYSVDLAAFINQVHSSLIEYQKNPMLKDTTHISIRRYYYNITTGTLYVSCEFNTVDIFQR